MESKIEGSVLDIHFGNKTDVDICRTNLVEKNKSDHCEKAVCPYPTHYLLGCVRLYNHHTYISVGGLSRSLISTSCG
jgi:hypothetical protein